VDPLTKPEWRAGVNQVLSPMWRVGEGDPSGLAAPIGATYRQTDANSTYGNLTGLLWNKVGTGTTLGTDWLVDFEGRWISYTPTLTASAGTFTSTTTTGAYTMYGKTVHARIKIVVTTVGTATGGMIVTLPVNTSTQQMMGYGREDVSTGMMLQARWNSSSQCQIWRYDNASVIAANTFYVSLTYEVA